MKDASNEKVAEMNKGKEIAHISMFQPKSNKPLQVYVLASILLASKTADSNFGAVESQIPLKKIQKFAGYTFTNTDMAKAELKILEALNYDLDFRDEPDNLYEMILVQINQIQNLVAPSKPINDIPDEIKWLLN